MLRKPHSEENLRLWRDQARSTGQALDDVLCWGVGGFVRRVWAIKPKLRPMFRETARAIATRDIRDALHE